MKKNINILHVEDSEKIVMLMRLMLLQSGNVKTIETANTLAMAKEIMNVKKIDAVVLDMHLPDGNGIALLKWIKQNYPGIVVIMLTNFSDDYFRSAAQKANADYFFDKSSEFELVLKAVSGIVLKEIQELNKINNLSVSYEVLTEISSIHSKLRRIDPRPPMAD